ncbi:hypothetical protein ACLKA7_006350 [Drosophila subpalustris]
MLHTPKLTYTLPRKTELHTSTPRLIGSKKSRKNPKPHLNQRFQNNDNEGSVRIDEDDDQDQTETSSCDEDELQIDLYSCYRHVTEAVPDVNEKHIVALEKRLQSYPSIAGVDCNTLYSKAAKFHARDRLLGESQQQKVEMVQAMEMMNAITIYNIEGIGKDGKYSTTVSVAKQLATQHKRQLSSTELMVLSLRNFWFDNLEIKIGDNFMHIDRYLFQYFANAFADHNNHCLELPTHKASINLLGEIYSWLINDKNELELNGNFLNMYTLVQFLDMRRALEQFWYNFAISDKYGCWEKDAFMAYLKVRQMPCSDMVAIMLSRIRKCFLPVVASIEFLEMKAKEVIFLFNLDTICVNSEDEVFFAGVRWLEHKWSKRQKYLVEIMASVRMRLLSPWLQWSIVYRPESKVIRQIGSNAQVRALLWDACLFGEANVTQIKPTDETDNVLNRKYNKVNEVQRFWVYCPGVPHHHDVNCPLFRKLTYKTFKLFLNRLHTACPVYINTIKEAPQKHWNTYKCCKDSGMDYPKFQKRPTPNIYNIYDIGISNRSVSARIEASQFQFQFHLLDMRSFAICSALVSLAALGVASPLGGTYLPPHVNAYSGYNTAASGSSSSYASAPVATGGHYAAPARHSGYASAPVAAPSRQYLAPAATSLSSYSTSGATQSSYSAPRISHSSYATSASSHAPVAAPSRQYLAPAVSHSSYSSAASSYSPVAAPSRQYLAPAASRSIYSSPAVSHSSYSAPASAHSSYTSSASSYAPVAAPAYQYRASSPASYTSYSAPAVSHARSYSAPARHASSHGHGYGGYAAASSASARSQGLGYGYSSPAAVGGTRYASNGGYLYRL